MISNITKIFRSFLGAHLRLNGRTPHAGEEELMLDSHASKVFNSAQPILCIP